MAASMLVVRWLPVVFPVSLLEKWGGPILPLESDCCPLRLGTGKHVHQTAYQ
jgi:hypothetical protein